MWLNFICQEKLSPKKAIAVVRAVGLLSVSAEWSCHPSISFGHCDLWPSGSLQKHQRYFNPSNAASDAVLLTCTYGFWASSRDNFIVVSVWLFISLFFNLLPWDSKKQILLTHIIWKMCQVSYQVEPWPTWEGSLPALVNIWSLQPPASAPGSPCYIWGFLSRCWGHRPASGARFCLCLGFTNLQWTRPLSLKLDDIQGGEGLLTSISEQNKLRDEECSKLKSKKSKFWKKMVWPILPCPPPQILLVPRGGPSDSHTRTLKSREKMDSQRSWDLRMGRVRGFQDVYFLEGVLEKLAI